MSKDVNIGVAKVPKGIFWVSMLIIGLLVLTVMATGQMNPLELFAIADEDKKAEDFVPPIDRVPDGKVAVQSTVKLHVVDMLNERAAVANEADAILFYSLTFGDNPYPTDSFPQPTAAALMDTVNLTSGWATSVAEFWSGTSIFVKANNVGTFNDSDRLYFNFGQIYEVPYADSDQATDLPLGDMELIRSADYFTGSSNTDMFGQYPIGTDSWSDASATEIDVASLTEITLGIRVYQDDDDTAFADHRSWIDYSALANGDTDLMYLGSYAVIDFQLVSGASITTSVDDYLFIHEAGAVEGDTSGSGITFFTWGTGLTVFIPLDSLDEVGAREVDSNGRVINNHDGYKIIADLLIDVTTVPDATDEIDINLSIVSQYALAYAATQRSLDYSNTAIVAFGEVYTAWGTDWSLG